MSTDRDSMVLTPRAKSPKDSGPRRRAAEARKLAAAKRRRAKLLSSIKKAKALRHVQTGASLAKPASKLGGKASSRVLGGLGVALLVMDAVNAAGSGVRRAEQGVSGRLLNAMDQNDIYGNLDEIATGAARGREQIEGRADLLKIVGIEGRVNSQIGQLGSWFRERETARAIGADLIAREPAMDYLGTIADKAIAGSVSGLKRSADSAINAIRGILGKGPIER